MKRSIDVTISESGEIQVEVSGVRGSGCGKTTAFLEEALGTVQSRRRKPEFYRNATRVNKQRLER